MCVGILFELNFLEANYKKLWATEIVDRRYLKTLLTCKRKVSSYKQTIGQALAMVYLTIQSNFEAVACMRMSPPYCFVLA